MAADTPKIKHAVPSLIPLDHNADDYKKMRDEYTHMENLRGRLMTDRAPYLDHWYDIQALIDPHSTIWDPSMSGFPTFDDILPYSQPFQAFDDMVAGLQSGITPATQEWHLMEPEDEELLDDESVMDWCHKLNEEYKRVFQKSNFYQMTPSFYRQGSRILTAAMMGEEDFVTRARFKVFPAGSYYVSNNNRGVVDTFVYEFRWKFRQVVEEFCTDAEGNIDLSRLDRILQLRWKDINQRELPLNLVYVVEPNPDHDPSRADLDSAVKKYRAVYYIRDSAEKKILEKRGFDRFPIWVFRWYRQPTDAYGIDGPGFKALGDVSQLYEEVKLKLTALQKVVEPPMVGPASLASYPKGTTPGFFTLLPEGAANQKDGFRTAYQIEPDLKAIQADIMDLEKRIERICMADIFRMLANDDRTQPRTATEIMQKIQETYNLLGPVYGNFEFEWLQPMFDWLFDLFMRQGALPAIPPQLRGRSIKVKFVSRVAMALKLVETAAYEKFLDFMTRAKEINPNVTDTLDWDAFVKKYGESNNLPLKLFLTEDKVNLIRQSRAKLQQAQQATEALPKVAGAARDLTAAGTAAAPNNNGPVGAGAAA